jgi:hypothetical protein
MRLLQRPQRDRHILIDKMLAGIAELVRGQAGADAFVRIDEDFARLIVLDLVEFQFIGRHAAADADIEPAVAEMIEHADFLDQPQRRIERQQINQRPEPQALGRARDGAEIDARHRHHIERRRVMLGDVQAIEAGRVRRLGEAQPLIEQSGQRPFAVFDVVEESDFHDVSLIIAMLMGNSL